MLSSHSVNDHHGLDPTVQPYRVNQHGADMGDIEVTEDMTSYFRNIFHEYCDEPEQPEDQGLAKQKQQNDNLEDGQDSDSDSDSDCDQLRGGAILPELIKLTLAQHRMILSLRDVNKEAGVQLRITNARLDLVEEELSLMRGSLATEQATPSLFSGVRVRMGSSFGGTERDTTGDYVPNFDLTGIAATLAAGPGSGRHFNHLRNNAPDAGPGTRSSNLRRRSLRPEREEHVKRNRISYDALGGQDPKVPPSTYVLSSTPTLQSTATATDETSESELFDLEFPSESSFDTTSDSDILPQPSLLRRLCGKLARLLLGM